MNKKYITNCHHGPWTWIDVLEQHRQCYWFLSLRVEHRLRYLNNRIWILNSSVIHVRHKLGLWILFSALTAQTIVTSKLTPDIVEYFHTDNSIMVPFMINIVGYLNIWDKRNCNICMVFVRLIVNMDFPPVSVYCIINVQWLVYVFNTQQCPTTVTNTENKQKKKHVFVMMMINASRTITWNTACIIQALWPCELCSYVVTLYKCDRKAPLSTVLFSFKKITLARGTSVHQVGKIWITKNKFISTHTHFHINDPGNFV